MPTPSWMDVDRITSVLASVARPIILESFSLTSCIVSTRVVVDVLGEYGFEVEPVPVQLLVMNRSAVRTAERFGVDEAARIARGFSADEPGGPWAIGIGYEGGEHPGSWPGHLVAVVATDDPERSVMVDLSIDQASRPVKSLVLEPMTFEVPRDWKAGDSGRFPLPGGGSAVYRRMEPTAIFMKSPNWDPETPEVASTIARVRDALRGRVG